MLESGAAPPTAARLPAGDRVVLGILGFFAVVAFSCELFWLVHARELPQLAPTRAMARLFRVYGDADRSYYDAVTPLSLALEGLNVCFTQALGVWLMLAIVRRRDYRHALQLALGAYLAYSVVLYFLRAHLSGYAEMRYRSGATFLLFYGVNLPWLVGPLYLICDSVRAIRRRFGD
jgi:hypothetical protein